ncbi:YybH family protein [Methylocaldum sp. MU1018]|jgi:ketosteroid isomerase-like protein
MTTETIQAYDEARIRQIIADHMSAICSKDVNRIMSYYAPDVVFFDCKPPFQTIGAEAYRRIWEECLPCFPASFAIETRDLGVFVSGDLALAHRLFRLAGEEKDHPAMRTWIRATAGYQRKQGNWRIVHEHCSLPFDPPTGKAVFALDL